MKEYIPRETPEHEFLNVELLDMLGTDQYFLNISEYWGIYRHREWVKSVRDVRIRSYKGYNR